jgi:hypothetical protein
MSNIEQSEPEGEEHEPFDSTAVIDTDMRQRRLALIMGVGCLISAGIALWTNGWDGEWLTVLLIGTGSALVLYWKTGLDPRGFGKPIWGKKNTD